ncbi:MAG: adenine methyltransferase, partial [Deltaproteobacteria bacterium RBG_16_71_12]
MAEMFILPKPTVRLLDAGAGVGSLTAAAVAQLAARPDAEQPSSIEASAYELDETIVPDLSRTLSDCAAVCAAAGIEFSADLQVGDFVKLAAEQLEGGLFARPARHFNAAILNPPYRKINSASDHRLALRAVGVETSNLYAAFLALVVKLLDDGGELVAITPRSFCNGPYFRPFRELFLDAMALRRIHVFDSRSDAFGDDDVLQENVIIHAVKGAAPGPVVVTSNCAPGDEWTLRREVPFEEVVQPGDAERFIHIVPDVVGAQVAACLSACRLSLPEIDVEVSTGRVVDFRAKEHLRAEPDPQSVPLIYPAHFAGGRVAWPNARTRKPNAIVRCEATESLLVPRADYVLVKRFSSKEERRRIVAAVYGKAEHAAPVVGFENHLNVFHRKGAGLPLDFARGLAAFLNSTLVDLFFRQFNGHTQVNATDLRTMRYPSAAKLAALGRKIGEAPLDQEAVDALVEQELIEMSRKAGPDPVGAKRKIEQALEILKALGLPKGQLNERSALTLLASLNVAPRGSWMKCDAPLLGITPMMDFMAKHYGKTYAPNTRETVRRQTVHQFVQAGLLVENPDDPSRPINNPKWCYQVAPAALDLLRTFGTTAWEHQLAGYLASVQTLKDKYARARAMTRIPVTLPDGGEIKLSAGGQNP